MNPEIHRILIEADERGQYEFPQNFDAASIERQAREVHREILESGYEAGFEDWIHNQDASFGLAITIDSFAVRAKQGTCVPTIRFSNFGNLASLTWQDRVDQRFSAVARNALRNHGFTFVPESELDEPDDGIKRHIRHCQLGG